MKGRFDEVKRHKIIGKKESVAVDINALKAAQKSLGALRSIKGINNTFLLKNRGDNSGVTGQTPPKPKHKSNPSDR